MRISPEGLTLIKRFEGLRLHAYQDVGGVWTIGYGTTRTPDGPVAEGQRITQTEAEAFLADDVREFEQGVDAAVTVGVTQPMFDALVSLAYNVGLGAFRGSTLLRKLNARDWEGAAAEFARWNKVGQTVVDGLTRRRAEEAAVFRAGVAQLTMQPAGPAPAAQPTASAPVAEAPAPAAPAPPPPYIDPMRSPEEARADEAWVRIERERLEAASIAATDTPGGPTMPLPVSAVVALGGELLKLLPFAAKPQQQDKLDTLAQQLVRIAQAVQPASVNEQQAVEQVRANPQLQRAFVAEAASQWSELQPLLEFEAGEREKARGFVEALTSGDAPMWRQIGAAGIVGVLSLLLIGGGGWIFYTMLIGDALDAGQKGMVLGALLAAFSGAVSFWFGSSASSQRKDRTIEEQARK